MKMLFAFLAFVPTLALAQNPLSDVWKNQDVAAQATALSQLIDQAIVKAGANPSLMQVQPGGMVPSNGVYSSCDFGSDTVYPCGDVTKYFAADKSTICQIEVLNKQDALHVPSAEASATCRAR